MATTKENTVPFDEQTVSIVLPLLEDDSGHTDQTVEVERNGYILRFKRGVQVDLPVWAFIIMKESGMYPTL